MEPTKGQAGATEPIEPHVGGEQQEPGAPTRRLDDEGDASAQQEVKELEEIARQQGTSQRGYTADGPHEERPAQFDPEHPGGRAEGDPRR